MNRNGCSEGSGLVEISRAGTNEWVRGRQFEPVRIWLVDDNNGFRGLLGSLLNSEVDFECLKQFSSPDAAIDALAREEAPDIILLDIEMGEHNGLDAIRPIKAVAAHTHVLMLTTFAGPEARARAFREGASDFMLKSWPFAEMVHRIRQAVEFGTVAGLLTAFLSQEKAVAVAEPVKVAPLELPNPLERGLVYLRELFNLSHAR